MYRKILVPLDGSELAEAIIPQARMLAQCSGAEIVLLRVVNVTPPEYPELDAPLAQSAADSLRAEAQQYLDRMACYLKLNGIKVSTVLGEGAVADNILNYTDASLVDLIAMATHGRSGLGRWLIGSVADRVVHGAKVPVLLVRVHPDPQV